MRRFSLVGSSFLAAIVCSICTMAMPAHGEIIEVDFIGTITEQYNSLPRVMRDGGKVTGTITYEVTQAPTSSSTSESATYYRSIKSLRYTIGGYSSYTPPGQFADGGMDAIYMQNDTAGAYRDSIQFWTSPYGITVSNEDAEMADTTPGSSYTGGSLSGVTITIGGPGAGGSGGPQAIDIDQFVLELSGVDGDVFDSADSLPSDLELDDFDLGLFLISVRDEGYVIGRIDSLSTPSAHTLPEPTSALLLGFGIGGFALRRKRRRGC